MAKRPIGIDVLEAATDRIEWTFDAFGKVYLSFSAGKDSTVMLELTAEIARKRGRRFGVLLVDLEGQYKLTIEHAIKCFEEYADVIEPYWVAIPIALRNAVSVYEPKWECWDPEREADWIRTPPDFAITDPAHFGLPGGMEFEEFVPLFGEWYADGEECACLVGIVLVIGNHAGVNRVTLQKFRCHPCVFTGNQVRRGQGLQRADGDIAEIANGRGNDIKPGRQLAAWKALSCNHETGQIASPCQSPSPDFGWRVFLPYLLARALTPTINGRRIHFHPWRDVVMNQTGNSSLTNL